MLKYFLGPLLFFSAHGILAASQPIETPTLSVTGLGEVFAEPEQASIQVGVTAEAVTAREAQDRVNTAVQQVLAALIALDLDRKQIQTSQLNLQAVYRDARNRTEANEPRIVGYRASYSLWVRTEDLSQISSVIDTALEAGANQLAAIRFELKNETNARKEALQKAVADAMEKGKIIARAAGTETVRVLEIVEVGAAVRPFPMTRYEVMASEVSGSPTPVMPGQVTVSGQVTIRYELSQE